ncbi:hypothetical protein G7Y79_00039g076140 [Physcia stellaris]|nr:hypothetical protein G7Y79_00039g076140 [Physcia stellaris]
MPFRAKMKRAFGRDSPEEGSDAAQTNSKASHKKEKKQKLPDNVYKPGEPMPRPKYRGPYDKEHQDKLTSFNFANAFSRRKSDYSETSPMGTKLHSRRGSFLSIGKVARSRQPSHVDPALVEATDGDDDVTNVGLSKQHTREESKRPRTADSGKRPRTSGSTRMQPLQETATVTAGNANGTINGLNYGKPFTEDELTQAMSRRGHFNPGYVPSTEDGCIETGVFASKLDMLVY